MATKPFLPARWWEWSLTILLLAFLGAIFLPPRVSMGPTFGPSSIARDIQNLRRKTGRWPEAGDRVEFSPRFKDRAYDYDLRGSRADSTTYRIIVDDRNELWRIPISGERPRRLARF